jgi:hypothetical protein
MHPFTESWIPPARAYRSFDSKALPTQIQGSATSLEGSLFETPFHWVVIPRELSHNQRYTPRPRGVGNVVTLQFGPADVLQNRLAKS